MDDSAGNILDKIGGASSGVGIARNAYKIATTDPSDDTPIKYMGKWASLGFSSGSALVGGLSGLSTLGGPITLFIVGVPTVLSAIVGGVIKDAATPIDSDDIDLSNDYLTDFDEDDLDYCSADEISDIIDDIDF